MYSFLVGIPRGICQLCAPGIWPLAPEASASLESLALTFPQLLRGTVPRGPPEEASAQEKRPRRSSPSAHSGNPLVAAMFPAPKPAPHAAGRAPGTRRGNRATSRGHRRKTATPRGVTTSKQNPPLIHPETGRRPVRRLSNASRQAPP